jgi:hypothetical protein
MSVAVARRDPTIPDDTLPNLCGLGCRSAPLLTTSTMRFAPGREGVVRMGGISGADRG